jgi:nucleoside-triphosphatase
MNGENILITGRPGVGKTTLIRKLAESLQNYDVRGFYTREIRVAGTRRGFELVDLSGDRFTLAHVDIGGRYRVGKYGVDIKAFDDYLRARDFGRGLGRLIIIDEIGKMECFSALFVQMITDILNSDRIVIATIAASGGGIIQQIKSRRDVRLIEIDPSNRDSAAARIARMIVRKDVGQ